MTMLETLSYFTPKTLEEQLTTSRWHTTFVGSNGAKAEEKASNLGSFPVKLKLFSLCKICKMRCK